MAFTTAAAVELTIDPSRPAPAGPAAVEVEVDGIPATAALARTGSPVLRVLLPRLDGPPRKRILSLRARPFRMTELGLSPDARDLAVRVLSVRIEP
jgi:hypothetical protein